MIIIGHFAATDKADREPLTWGGFRVIAKNRCWHDQGEADDRSGGAFAKLSSREVGRVFHLNEATLAGQSVDASRNGRRRPGTAAGLES